MQNGCVQQYAGLWAKSLSKSTAIACAIIFTLRSDSTIFEHWFRSQSSAAYLQAIARLRPEYLKEFLAFRR